ncbi:MAG TPA: D-glycerate dehydrogenase [Anaerovoracaceae bacterium]|nr:D-glycerate dehydrogenase [Anaerovoracaceae bacterium]
MKMKVLIGQRFFGEGISLLEERFELIMRDDDKQMTRKEIKELIKDADAALFMATTRIDKDLLKDALKLKISANFAVGVDNVDIEYANSRNLIITNTPDVVTNATVEMTWALIFATSRRIIEADALVRSKTWEGFSPNLLLGKSIDGKTLGIIGAGRIGQGVGKKAKCFNMKVIYSGNTRKIDFEKETGAKFVELDELLREADIVTIHAPFTKQTEDLISKRELALMKKSAIFINAARGGFVNEDDLIEALKNRDIWGAGLDVFKNEPHIKSEIFKLDNVVLSPHIGTAEEETRDQMGILAAKNIIEVLEGREALTKVN